MFTTKVNKEERMEMRKTGMQMKQRYEQFVSGDEIMIYPRERTAATDDTFRKPRNRSKSINREFGDKPPLIKQRSRSIDAGNRKKEDFEDPAFIPKRKGNFVSTVANLFIPLAPPSPEDERKSRKASKTPNTGNSPTVTKKVSGVITPPSRIIPSTPPKTPNVPRNNPPTPNKTPTPARKTPSTNSNPPKSTGVPRNNPPSPSSQKKHRTQNFQEKDRNTVMEVEIRVSEHHTKGKEKEGEEIT